MKRVHLIRRTFLSTFGLLIGLFLLAAPPPGARPADGGSGPLTVDAADLVPLSGTVPSLARARFDVGPARPDLPMNRIILTFKLSRAKRAELTSLLASQQDPASPQYHHWLTPEEFGRRFGPDQSTVDAVTGWLRGEGFKVDSIAKGRMWIDFSGTAREVEQAFGTQIHNYIVKGVMRRSNAADISIPRALTPYVAGVVSLNSFPRQAMNTGVRLLPSGSIQPYYTYGYDHYLSPDDYAVIYDINPLYDAGITGSGVTVAIVGRTHPPSTDWSGFRAEMGLPANPVNVIVNGTDPGDLGSGEDGEADLDVEWSGAVARDAQIDFVISQSTYSTDGVDLSAQYIVDNQLAPVMSTSFGSCESKMGSAENNFYENLWAQADTEGISAFVSSGDSGASVCDAASSSYGSGQGVNGIASTPYDVAVGGTEFDDGSGTYWSSTNSGSGYDSALSYIPEVAWNESGTVTSCPVDDTCQDLWATGGGASIVYAKPSWQTCPGVPSDGARDLPDVSMAAAQHDAYIVDIGGGLYPIGGTSAASPSMAGIMALIVQQTGQWQGNPNPRFYQLGAAQYGGTGPVVFHDVTLGDNSVPGVTGFSCGTGYDQATGLGSLDVSALAGNWAVSCTVDCTAAASANSGAAPLDVTFTATATPSNCAGTPSYYWDFGDGSSSTNQVASHTYVAPGQYTWTLTVSAGDATCTKSGALVVGAGCSLTAAAVSGPSTGDAPLAVSFAASAAASGCTGSPAYSWDFGDGASSAAQNPTHTYAAAGTYTWTMTATLGQSTATRNGTVVVSSNGGCSLACSANVPSTGNAGSNVAFASDVTPCYLWDFGDGTTATTKSPSHVYPAAGTYDWTLTVKAGNLSCTKAGTIAIANVPPPVITSISKAGGPFRITVGGSNLQNGIKVYINGTQWSEVTWKSDSTIKLTGGHGLKEAVPKGIQTTFRFVNPDGGEVTKVWSY